MAVRNRLGTGSDERIRADAAQPARPGRRAALRAGMVMGAATAGAGLATFVAAGLCLWVLTGIIH